MTRNRERPSPTGPWPDRLDRAALFIVLCVICARGVIQEQPDAEQVGLVNRLQGAPSGFEGPGPATSLVLDGLILAAAAMCICAAGLRGRFRSRLNGLELACGLMVVAAGVSLILASNKRLAINCSVDRIAAMTVMLIVVQTVSHWWQARLILTAIGATAVTFAAFCITQRHELEDTRQWFQKQREQAVASGRISADDPMVELLERRAKAGEANGFFSHSNIAGAYLMAGALATLAMGLARLRARTRPFRVFFGVVTVLASGLVTLGLALTHSRGAMAAGGICAAGWLLISLLWYASLRLRELISRHGYAFLAGGWGVAILLGAGVVAYGLHEGGLPSASLAFRWNYWTVAARIVAHHPWFGVGAGNFDRHYVHYKPVEMPEEIKDPHNFLLTAASEWGIVGLVATIGLLVAVSVALCSRPTPTSNEREGPPSLSDKGGRIFLWLLPLLATVLAARTLATPEEIWLLWAFIPAVVWAIAALALSIDSDQVARFEDDPLMLTGGLIAALFGVLIDNTISFSLVYPGSACTFYALAGLAIAVRRIGKEPVVEAKTAETARIDRRFARTLRPGWLAVATAAIVAAAIVYWRVLVAPVSAATQRLGAARIANTSGEVLEDYRRAVDADPLDPVAADELACWAIRRERQAIPGAGSGAQIAVDNALIAVCRDPQDNRHYRTLSNAYAARHAVTNDPNDADRAADAMARAVQLYPELPALRIDYGEMLALQAVVRRDPQFLGRAIAEMRYALQLDDRRSPGEIRRFKPSYRTRIEERIRALQATPLTTTRP
jgi:hypothetical protein